MKKLLFYTTLFSFVLIFAGCSADYDNGITLKNMASGAIMFNFRGTVVTVQAGETKTIRSIRKGSYDYSTTYSVPSNATSSGSSGPLSGIVNITPSSKILILFSSTFTDGIYTIYATMSSSESIEDGTTTP